MKGLHVCIVPFVGLPYTEHTRGRRVGPFGLAAFLLIVCCGSAGALDHPQQML